MSTGRMHADEAETGRTLVRRLLAAQFPQWAHHPLEPVRPAGTSNAMYRLGEDLVVRLPRIAGAAADVAREHHWLPRLAPELPVAVPVPLGLGTPAFGYPWPWSVYRWLDGETPAVGAGGLPDPARLAGDLADLLHALRRIDPADGPASYRSEPLAARDTATRSALAALRATGDTEDAEDADAAAEVWETSLRTAGHPGPAGWIHADLQPGNVLLVDGRLGAVIDFGCAGTGDPAVDLIAAWYLLPAAARAGFRAKVGDDDAVWSRGRAWALSIALMEASYYRTTNPAMAATARHVIGEVVADHRQGR
ncbi:aminoglycoside phosphotransferase family protein [Kitasatospora sp. NPDC048540]|uniref:aminoglycoside phosphotransferase family protein n=1 Tax=Kitasatospora sp. NPDC048540 TaxID=3155634 RepID=UPI0033FD7EB6